MVLQLAMQDIGQLTDIERDVVLGPNETSFWRRRHHEYEGH
jgi:hypothetical protein